MNRYISATSRDSSQQVAKTLQPFGKRHRNSISSPHSSPLATRPVVKKLASSPGKLSPAKDIYKRKQQRILDFFVSPKKAKFEPFSNSQKNSRVNSRTCCPSRRQSGDSVIDLTKSEEKSITRPENTRILEEKDKIVRTSNDLIRPDDPSSEKENASDNLHDMYSLFTVLDSANSNSPSNGISNSGDDDDMPEVIFATTPKKKAKSSPIKGDFKIIGVRSLNSEVIDVASSNDANTTICTFYSTSPSSQKSNTNVETQENIKVSGCIFKNSARANGSEWNLRGK